MNREQAKLLWETDLSAGYSPAEAKERLAHFAKTGIALPDPTEKYWPALIHQESGGNQSAVSPKGATGVAQVMPETGPEAAALAGVEWDPIAFKEDPAYNARLGRAYFRKQMVENGNDPKLALAAYNAGPGAVRKAGGDLSRLPAETQNYVPTIMNRADQSMQPDLDAPGDVAQAQEALMTPKDRARKAYEDVLANGGSPEEAKAAIQQFITPKAAPVEQEAPAPATLAKGATPASDVMTQKIVDPVARQQELLQGGTLDRFKAGLERSVGGVDRGARKLLGQLLGDDAAVQKTEQQEQAIRDIYDKMDPQGSGFSAADAGKLTGDIGAGALIGKAMPGGILGGAGAGAIQGGLQPTTANDSQALNAGVGGFLGGTVGAIGKGLTALIGKADPTRQASAEALRAQGVDIPKGQEYNSPIGAALRKMGGEKGSTPIPEDSLTASLAKMMGIPGSDITNSTLEQSLRTSGKAIGDLHINDMAMPDKKFGRDIIDIGQKYYMSGPVAKNDPVIAMADHLLDFSREGGRPMSGQEYQALRSGLTADSVKGTAAEKIAMGDMKRALDNMFQSQNPKPEAAGLRSQYRLAKILRSGSGIPAEGMTARQLRNRIEGAANKGQVSSDVRELLNDTNRLIPKSRLGGDAAEGAGDDVVVRGLDRPGLVSGLMALTRGVAGPASKVYDKGLIQALVNNPSARASLASLLRGGVIPQAAKIEEGER